jgi:tetratricopeptide (TPR) repeat protein
MPGQRKTAQERREAIAAAERAIQDDPTDYRLLGQLGWAYFEAERYDDAMDVFQRGADLYPDRALAYNAIGRVYERTGPPEKAIKAYERAIDLDPQWVVPYHGLGIVYTARLGDYEAALDAYQRAMAVDPENAFTLSWLGLTYARMGQIDRAVASLEETLRRQPDNDDALSSLAIVYLHQKRYDDVIAACQRQIEIEDDRSARLLLGYVYDHLGCHEEALAELERAVALDPEDYEVRGALAKVLRTVGRQGDAEAQYALAISLASRDNEYGQACFAAVSGDVERAVALLKVGLAEGQVQPGWARIDPEFAFIRDDPRFVALIESA